MLSFIKHQSLDDIDFVKKPSEKQFVDRWKFKVTLPDYDADKMRKAIADVPCVDQYSIETELTPWKMNISFEVTDYGFSEYMKAFIERNGWHCMVINSPRSYSKDLYNTYKVTTYKDILSSLSGLPTSASDKEHAEAIVKGDTKMSKVKTQAPTYYPSFMKFIKVIRSGPVTVAWIKSNKKVMIRKTKKDKDDLEKAMLMLFAKSQFDSEAAFHRWFRDQMKLFEEANNNAKN